MEYQYFDRESRLFKHAVVGVWSVCDGGLKWE